MRLRRIVPLLLAAPGWSAPVIASGLQQHADPVTAPRTGPDTASNYSSEGLRALVARASRQNTVVPRGLESYQVTAESELAFLLHRPDGTEGATQIEQIESVARWLRSGAFTQHIIGYRSQLAGPNLSALALVKQAWIVPVLYGNRLGLFLGRDSTHAAEHLVAHDDAVRVVHPFAIDRDAVYRYAGGDTALTIRVLDKTIPVVVVHVTARPELARRTVVFRGDVYVDLANAAIVRMRGAFETVGGHTPLGSQLQGFAYRGAAYIDLTNREVSGRYWLPDEQRVEGEVSSPLLGEVRTVFRIVTHFGPYTTNGTPNGTTYDTTTRIARADSAAADTASPPDSLRVLPHFLSIAPGDSLTSFSNWQQSIGIATRAAQDSDFTDVAPDRWRPTGAPHVGFGVQAYGDLLHFDRVEGLFTGGGTYVRFRDAAPGLSLWTHAGWAWSERTVRGGLSLEWRHGRWLVGTQASRSLDATNDFTTVFTSGPFLESLIVQDDYDYVDRRTASVYASHEWVSASGELRYLLRVEGGVGDDKGDRDRLRHGIFPPSFLMSDSLFRPNRNVLPGDYGRGSVVLDINPGIDAGFVGEGVGGRIAYQVAGGQLGWQRAEARFVVRHAWGPFTVLGRADGGIVAGTVIPPQQMFEIGSMEGLLAYTYKQFAGNVAAIWQGEASYALPFWDAPLHIGSVFLPSPAPALAIDFQSGWTEVNTLAGQRALVGLGWRVNPATNAVLTDSLGVPIPVSETTNGVRTSVNLLVRFFGGAAGIGVAHSLDPGTSFQFVLRLGAAL